MGGGDESLVKGGDPLFYGFRFESGSVGGGDDGGGSEIVGRHSKLQKCGKKMWKKNVEKKCGKILDSHIDTWTRGQVLGSWKVRKLESWKFGKLLKCLKVGKFENVSDRQKFGLPKARLEK